MHIPTYCVQRTNIQNLKAIHNHFHICLFWRNIVFKERIYKIWKQFTTANGCLLILLQLCSKNEYTKSESNSQLSVPNEVSGDNCVQRTNIQNLKAIHNAILMLIISALIVFKERIYKIWKQFTTVSTGDIPVVDCVQRTNIQNLKAIHNQSDLEAYLQQLCSKNEYTKSESNSQLCNW